MIIADAEYIDHVAFELTVNFERMLERRIPKADLSTWAVDISLDGGLRPGNNETQLVLIHNKGNKQLENFVPSVYDSELNEQAFKDDRMGEYLVSSIAVEEITSKEELLEDIVRTVCSQKGVKRVMIVPDSEEGNAWHTISKALREVDDDKRITLFAMHPMEGGNYRQEILGYSIMNALGIKAEEIK